MSEDAVQPATILERIQQDQVVVKYRPRVVLIKYSSRCFGVRIHALAPY
jgi:hypothetical protein